MAAKKYYGVRKGKIIGIFDSWEACKNSVDGYSGAEYKGFTAKEEAIEYLGDLYAEAGSDTPHQAEKKENRSDVPQSEKGTLLTYVDGSYNDGLKKYAFGCVFLPADGKVYTAYGNGDNEQSLQHRNVSGEMLGAMYAVKTAIFNGYSGIEICYDYEGIEKWVTGAWKSKTDHTRKYALAMREWGKGINIKFTKVPAHSNVKYNELADQTAKQGLTCGEGIPKIRKLEELTLWNQ